MVDPIQSVAPHFDDSLCVCGRPMGHPHCPYCGSSQVLCSARKRDWITRPDGNEVELRVYRCRVCGNAFNDDHRSMCGAPPPRNGQQRHNAALAPSLYNAKVPDFTTQPGALAAALAKIKKARGIE